MSVKKAINSMSFFTRDKNSKSAECINVKNLPRLQKAIIEEYEKQKDKVFLIWSIEHNAWWAPSRRGYVKERSKAGGYRYSEAVDIVRSANIGLHDTPNEAMIQIEEQDWSF